MFVNASVKEVMVTRYVVPGSQDVDDEPLYENE
jgi:hypothetical protein